MMDGLLAVGLLLTTATQLRIGGLPVGPGEICLAIWVTFAFGQEMQRGGHRLTPAIWRLMTFWALIAAGEGLGTLTGFIIGDKHDSSLFLHDALAYPLVAAFSSLAAIRQKSEASLLRVAWTLTPLGSAALLLQLVASWGLFEFPLVDLWFGDRFQGWSNNPNQLALLCAVLVLTAIHLADTATRISAWVAAIACSIPPIIVGRLTKTDTFTFSLLVGGVIFFSLKLRIWLVGREGPLTLRSFTAAILVVAVPMMGAAVVPLTFSATADSERIAMGLMKNGGKEAAQETDLRLGLWQQAISRGLEAGMLGLGPGPHLPIPWSVAAGRQDEPDRDSGNHPMENGTANFEAHNTVLDLFTQGGIIAVLSFVWLMISALRNTYRIRRAGLTALLCGLVVFSMTDLIIRQPIFWFGITLCLVAGSEARYGRPYLEAQRHRGTAERPA